MASPSGDRCTGTAAVFPRAAASPGLRRRGGLHPCPNPKGTRCVRTESRTKRLCTLIGRRGRPSGGITTWRTESASFSTPDVLSCEGTYSEPAHGSVPQRILSRVMNVPKATEQTVRVYRVKGWWRAGAACCLDIVICVSKVSPPLARSSKICRSRDQTAGPKYTLSA